MKAKGFFKFVLEALAAFAMALAAVYLCDSRRVFASDEQNNHIGKKWHYLYQYAKQKKPVDILVVGNSHAYTGIIPETVKRLLGLRCFILAAPGVCMDDCSCMLEEALQIITPKVVVLETYPINGYVQKELDGQMLSDQFTSFENRRNKQLKLKSAPRLFSLENIPPAWSPTLRNHDIIFDNYELLQKNLKNPSGPKYKPDEEYLGRFTRFKGGLTEKTLERYKTEGAPVDGSAIIPGPDAVNATKRMVEMCRQKKINVMFLTVPMYQDHVSGAVAWHKNLSAVIGKTTWLDLQHPGYNEHFNPDCFEDTYNENQHQTIQGATRTTTILCEFLQRYTNFL